MKLREACTSPTIEKINPSNPRKGPTRKRNIYNENMSESLSSICENTTMLTIHITHSKANDIPKPSHDITDDGFLTGVEVDIPYCTLCRLLLYLQR